MSEQSVIVAHGDALARVGIKAIIESSCGSFTVSAVESFAALVRDSQQAPGSILIVDIDLPGMSGMTGLATLLRNNNAPRTCVAMHAVSRDIVAKCVASGILACIDHDRIAEEVCDAIGALAAGRPYFSRLSGDSPAHRGPLAAALIQQQLAVLQVLAQGKSNKQIGRELGICEGTVKVHLNAACRALGVVNRVSAVAKLRDISQANDDRSASSSAHRSLG